MSDKFRTIVGGRSRSNRLLGNFPRGIEILLKKASVDPDFCRFLLQDPQGAAESIELDLKPVEISILNNTSRLVLEKMISNTYVPKQHVKTFRTATATAMMILVMSTTVVVPVLAGGGQEELPAQTYEQEEITRNRMAVVQEALEAYRDDHGAYPSTEKWIHTPDLLSNYVPWSDLYDPWKRNFHYNAVKKNGKIISYKLESLGFDADLPEDNIPCPLNADQHRFTGVSPIKILFPLKEDYIVINAHPSTADSVVEFRAEHINENIHIDWYLNGNKIGTTVKAHNLIIEPDLGYNSLFLVDENEQSTGIHFRVENKVVTALFSAVIVKVNEDGKAVEELLRDGVDVNLTNETGDTALISAARYGRDEIVRILLHAGANVNVSNNWGNTALMEAVRNYGNLKTVHLLLNAGADANLKNLNGETASTIAIERGREEIERLLTEAGAIK